MSTPLSVTVRRTLALVGTCIVVTVVAVATSDDAPLGLASVLVLVLIAAGVIWAFADRHVVEVRAVARRVLVPLYVGAGFVTVLAVVPEDATSRLVRLAIVGAVAFVAAGVATGVSLAMWLLMRSRFRH